MAIQVDGKNHTDLVFNPPKDAPYMKPHPSIKKHFAYSSLTVVNAIKKAFSITQPVHLMWLDLAIKSGELKAYRLRNLTEEDKLNNF